MSPLFLSGLSHKNGVKVISLAEYLDIHFSFNWEIFDASLCPGDSQKILMAVTLLLSLSIENRSTASNSCIYIGISESLFSTSNLSVLPLKLAHYLILWNGSEYTSHAFPFNLYLFRFREKLFGCLPYCIFLLPKIRSSSI